MNKSVGKKRLLINLLVSFITMCIMLVAAEIVVRSFSIAPKEDTWVGGDKRLYEYDSLYGWRKVLNLSTARVNARGQNTVFFRVNSKGFRGPEYPYEKPDNEYRVLFLGDSFAEGYMVEENEIFTDVMELRLNNLHENIHVEALNSGTSGWGTDHELLFFLNEGKKYKPDLTILQFYQNDLYYNNQPKDWSMYYKPLYKIVDGKLVLTNVPVPKPDRKVNYDQLTQEKKPLLKNIKKWLYDNSHMYGLIKERINNTYFLHKLALQLHLMEDPGDPYKMLPREYIVWEKTYNEDVLASWAITEALLKKLKEETDAAGSRLLVLFVPFKASIHRDEWTRIKKNYGLSDASYSTDQPGIELAAVCKRNGIDFLDPTEMLRTKARELEKKNIRLYGDIDGHWNVLANQYVGEMLADVVHSNYMSPAK